MSDMPRRLGDVFERSDRIVGRRLADEYILVPIVSRGADVDAIFNLNRVGALIWERLDGRTSGQAVVDAIVERFEVDAKRAAEDYAEFIDKLVTIEAVRRVDKDH
jgi:coenzyme PQQ synthesis protein D (PqqD)